MRRIVYVCDVRVLQVTPVSRLKAAAEGWAGSDIVETITAGSPDSIRQLAHETSHCHKR